MKSQILFLFVLICVYANGVVSHAISHDESKRQVAPVVTESPAETLMRLKLLTYQEKLKAKEAKKQAKATKKAQKDAAFTSYMTAIAAGAAATPSAVSATPGVAPMAAAIPPMPMIPAMGLWKKSFLLSQIMAAAAAQNAAIAAAAAAATTTTTTTTTTSTTTPIPVVNPEEESDEIDEETKTINEIVKRYAPALRKKFYGVPKKHHSEKNVENDDDTEDETETQVDEDENEDEEPEVGNEDEEEEEDDPASYQSGSFNKFGTGPAGSPNGVGYEDAKVNQAGCSGSHIHICSGTTVYLTNPDEVTNQNPLLQNSQLKPLDEEQSNTDEAADEVKPKYGRKRLHHHRQ